ncbi:hypothetical protein [Rhizobium leguminosarum]|uniref:hypothetical protein n=1 Tax=Rhizobium leguminosarum TaxID=384 RepID=UPI00047FF002|nr:hypothetical protein [Rhizobium leguminosarum]
MSTTVWPRQPMQSEDVGLLAEVLDGWCVRNECVRTSPLAHRKAKSLVDWFELGVHQRDELARLLEDDVVVDEPNG